MTSRSAVALPMPDEAPVTSAIFLFILSSVPIFMRLPSVVVLFDNVVCMASFMRVCAYTHTLMKEAMQTTLSNKTTTEGSRMKIGTEDNMKRKIALVTGASSGIGKATAERLVMAGYKVYGTSRRGAQAGAQSFEVLPLDVTSDESVEAAVTELMRREGH